MNGKVRKPIQIKDGIFRFTEKNENGPYVDANLVVGRKGAILIDTLESDVGLLETIREITEKPLKVILTHGHPDHAGKATAEFIAEKIPVYLSENDYDMLCSFHKFSFDKNEITDLKEGMEFDLGEYVFQVISVPGHTAGSVALWEKNRKWLFSGDSIGAGIFWMQIPGCEPLHIFYKSLLHLISITGTDSYVNIFPGHSIQSPKPLNGCYLADLRKLTAGILEKSVTGISNQMELAGQFIKYKTAA